MIAAKRGAVRRMLPAQGSLRGTRAMRELTGLVPPQLCRPVRSWSGWMRRAGRNRSRDRRRGTAEDSGCRLRANASCGEASGGSKALPSGREIQTHRTKRTRAFQRSAGKAGSGSYRASLAAGTPKRPGRTVSWGNVRAHVRAKETRSRSGERNSGVGAIPYRVRYVCQGRTGCVELKKVKMPRTTANGSPFGGT